MNYLESLVAEWLEYRGYFVRRNVKVGKRQKGGWDGELDVVAYCPQPQELIHIECSMDADTWAQRETRLVRKFDIGRKCIPELFGDLCEREPEQFALFGYGSEKHAELAGARVVHIKRLLGVIAKDLGGRAVVQDVVPESFPILRTIQYMLDGSQGLGLGRHVEGTVKCKFGNYLAGFFGNYLADFLGN